MKPSSLAAMFKHTLPPSLLFPVRFEIAPISVFFKLWSMVHLYQSLDAH